MTTDADPVATAEPTDASTLLIATRRTIAEGIVELELVSEHRGPLPAWTPGAHLEVEVGNGLVRHYSLSGDPADRSAYRIAVLREPAGRGGSNRIHEHWHAGTTVRVRAIRDHFGWTPGAERVVFVAGGIGITPLLPMLISAERAGTPWELHYSGRSAAAMAYRDRLVTEFDDRIRLYGRGEGTRLDADGLVDRLPPRTAIYVCGPNGLIEAVTRAGTSRGLDVHRELFANAEIGADAPLGLDQFEVEFARSGVSVMVGPQDSILAAGETAGADVFGSCYEGICGTCETRVLDGTPVHRDVVTAHHGDSMMICVSRSATSRLVLDA